MVENQTKSTVSGRVPPDKKEALVYLAHGRNEPMGDTVNISTIVNEAVDEYLDKHKDEVETYRSQYSNDAEEGQKGAA